jgi:hypothetical protein
MAVITSYATLQTAIGDYLNRSDLTSFLPNFTQNAEQTLYRSLRIRAMETALSGTISGGVLALPADFLELKYAYVNTTPVKSLDKVAPDQIYSKWPVRSGTAEIPEAIAVEGSNFIFGPYPGGYAVAGIYYAKLTALSASNTTNWFITNAPDLLLYGSLLEAEAFILGDPRIPLWKAYYDQAYKSVEMQERRGKYGSGGSIAQRLG